jgi:hypothetical protein
MYIHEIVYFKLLINIVKFMRLQEWLLLLLLLASLQDIYSF